MNQQDKESRLWEKIKADINRQGGVGAYGFDAYISKLTLKRDTGTKLIFEYPADMLIYWVEVNYLERIRNSAARVLDAAREIEFVRKGETVGETDEQSASPSSPLPFPLPAEQASHDAAPESAATPEPGTARRRGTTRRLMLNSGLNEDYSFDNFVVGSNSEFAYTAAKAIAESPEQLYNPLFIHGASGLGKTHLLHAIGNAIRQRNDRVQVLYVTSESFTNTYIDALYEKGNALSNFRRRYRRADVLLIDDVQFLSQKNKTQEEFFHTFNALFASGKQIVLSADCPASEITLLDERLASRFEQGLTVGLLAPCLETRIAILRSKCRQWKENLLGDDVLEFLARSITCSVRRLEGALTRLASFSSLSRRKPSVAEARALLKDLLRDEKAPQVSIEEIQRRVAEAFSIRVADLNGRRRTANIAHPRQVAMFLARKHTQNSLQDIGAAFGGRDHGTVIHATRTVEQKMEQDSELREIIDRVSAALV